MNTKVTKAVSQLNRILPLHARLNSLNPEHANVYQLILKSYVELGRSLNKQEMSEHVESLYQTIKVLHENDMVVFDDQGEPTGAYPFTMEQREHKVTVNGHTVNSMCALDALAISPMFNLKTQIDSKCHVSGERISIEQFDQTIINKENTGDIHFGISWNSTADNCCATSLCTEMIFLKDADTANEWLEKDADNREIFNIDEAIDFSTKFFKPLVEEAQTSA